MREKENFGEIEEKLSSQLSGATGFSVIGFKKGKY